MTAARVLGHFGEWLQGCLGPQGPVALITVTCPALRMTATHLEPGGPLRLVGTGAAALPLARAQVFCKALQIDALDAGCISLDTRMPLGGGAGASTAALIALARVLRPEASAQILARACVASEGASDPLAEPAPSALLWAPRAGGALARAPDLPRVEIVGGFLEPGERTDPADVAFPDIAALWADWQALPLTPDRLGALSSASAQATTDLRGPRGDPTATLARDLGGLGWVRAHTGSARGVVFAPGAAPRHAQAAMVEAGLTRTLAFATGGA